MERLAPVIAQLFSDVVSLILLAAPAWILSRLLRPDAPTLLESVSETLLLGVTLVSIPVFTVAMLTRSYLGPDWMTAGALIVLGVVAVIGIPLVWPF